MAAKAAAKATVNPFKVKATKTPAAGGKTDAVTPPSNIAAAVDEFRRLQDQAKHFEGQATVHKDAIGEWARDEYAKRAMGGDPDSFKILGDESTATFVTSETGSGLTEEHLEELQKEVSAADAEKLVKVDYGSIRLDAETLEKNYDAVVAALQALPPEVLESLFKPATKVAVKGALGLARGIAKDADHLGRIMKALRLKNYIK